MKFELVSLIGKDSVFMDVDSIALGQDFRRILHERLESCDLVLALIGPGWLDAKDAAGHRRLESPTDLVRQEIAAALKRNIPVIPVLVQGAQMPQPDQLPDDITDLVYRNGFELGHSTWESDVTEMVKRLGFDRESPPPRPGPGAAQANSSGLRLAGTFKAPWVLAIFAIIAITAGIFFYEKAHDQGAGGESVASLVQPPNGSSPQPSGGSQLQQSAHSLPSQSAGSRLELRAGLGAIKIANLARHVEVYDQHSTGDNSAAAGYAGYLSPSQPILQVPAGTYKLKFANLFVQPVVVTSSRSFEILLATISMPNLARHVEVYEQNSTGDNLAAAGYAGYLSRSEPTLQVPAGTYKLKFANLFVQHVVVTSSRSLEVLLGTISLPNLARNVEVYDQNSTGDNLAAPGYAGYLAPSEPTLQVPAGTYKLKFANLFVQPVRVESGKTVIPQQR